MQNKQIISFYLLGSACNCENMQRMNTHHITKVGQNHISVHRMTVYLVISLPKLPYTYGSSQPYTLRIRFTHKLTHIRACKHSTMQNLFLRLRYHQQVIDLGDDMDFKLLPEGAQCEVLECSDPTVPTDDSNLVIKVSVVIMPHAKSFLYEVSMGGFRPQTSHEDQN